MEFLYSPVFIALVFFVIAFVYSSVGLGGGSSYIALMTILNFSAVVIPMVSLILNLLVTSISSFNFIRYRHAKLKLILPFLISSIPMAYLGGLLEIPKIVFYWLLLISLLIVAVRIYGLRDIRTQIKISERKKILVSVLCGGVLGLVAGMVGIGGGIVLVPLILLLGLASEKQAAACGAIFIWANSAAGLSARIQYQSIDISHYLPLIAAVVVGSMIGSLLGAKKLNPKSMQKILGFIILIAIVLLFRKIISY